MEMLRQEMLEIFPQTYLDCYELCLALVDSCHLELECPDALRGCELHVHRELEATAKGTQSGMP